MSTGVRVVELAATLGVEVHGVDLRGDHSPAVADELRALLAERSLLLFRGEPVEVDDQVRLMELFGVVAPMSQGKHTVVSNDPEQGVMGESALPFHSDLTYTPAPYDTICMAALDVRGPAAPTRFASMVGGYAALPDALKARVAGLNTVHLHFHYDGVDFVKTDVVNLPEQREYATLEEYPRHTWPVVVPHHKTGEPMLFVSQWFSHIEGWAEDESERLLEELYEHLYGPANVYEHHWATGDVVVWDNLAVQHARPGFHGQGALRTLRKVITVPGGRSLAELYELAGAEQPNRPTAASGAMS